MNKGVAHLEGSSQVGADLLSSLITFFRVCPVPLSI